MLKKILQSFFAVSLIFLFFSGCATILEGYVEEVDLVNAPDDIKVFSKDGVEIPVDTLRLRTVTWNQETKEFEYNSNQLLKSIKLRKNTDHVLVLKYDDNEKIIEVVPTLDAGWAILDFLLVIPAFVDAYTGCWKSFQPISVEY